MSNLFSIISTRKQKQGRFKRKCKGAYLEHTAAMCLKNDVMAAEKYGHSAAGPKKKRQSPSYFRGAQVK